MLRPESILETCLYIDDLDAAEQFYGTVLNLELRAREEGRHLFFRCGQGMLLLFIARATLSGEGEPPPHGAVGPGHAAFAVSAGQLAKWKAHLLRNGVSIEREIRWPNGGRSLYFRDPSGNSLELATPSIWNLHREGK